MYGWGPELGEFMTGAEEAANIDGSTDLDAEAEDWLHRVVGTAQGMAQ